MISGDDPEWVERVNKTNEYAIGKYFIFFTDHAGLTWKDKPINTSMSETMEMYMGPAILVFNIPFTIGAFKVFVTILPVEGGSIMRVRTWIDGRTRRNPLIYGISWMLQGISASQLWCDIVILSNKIRLSKPLIQKEDGPFFRINTWLKNFYSENSSTVTCGKFKNDW